MLFDRLFPREKHHFLTVARLTMFHKYMDLIIIFFPLEKQKNFIYLREKRQGKYHFFLLFFLLIFHPHNNQLLPSSLTRQNKLFFFKIDKVHIYIARRKKTSIDVVRKLNFLLSEKKTSILIVLESFDELRK